MKLSFASILAMGIILASNSAAAAQCVEADKPGTTFEGALTQHTFRDAAGRPEKAFILTLSAPVCLSGTEESDNVRSARTIHIFSSDDATARRMQRFVDGMVLVRGTAFGALTVHHHAPIVMDISEITSSKVHGPPVAAIHIVEPSGDPEPTYSKSREPTAQELIETWRASNRFMPEKKVDRERFEIIDRRVAWDRFGRAFLQFRILSPSGDAMSFAMARCRGIGRDAKARVAETGLSLRRLARWRQLRERLGAL
jgi:hypothetical protein